jgi:hypothetical protein
MIRVGSSFTFRSSSNQCSLITNPFKRIQFGITGGLLLAGLGVAIGTGSLDQSLTPGFAIFLIMLVVSLGVAGYRKQIYFNRLERRITIGSDLFFLPLGKKRSYGYTNEAEIQYIKIDLFQRGFQPKEGGFAQAQAQANKRTLVKLMFHTGNQGIYLDESSVYGEAEVLAEQLSKFLSIPISSV